VASPRRLGLAGSLRFHRPDYGELAFPDELFDGAYTMQTLVHAYDHRRALAELRRTSSRADPGPVRVPGPR